MDKNPFRKQAQGREKENNRDEKVGREEHGEKCIQHRGEEFNRLKKSFNALKRRLIRHLSNTFINVIHSFLSNYIKYLLPKPTIISFLSNHLNIMALTDPIIDNRTPAQQIAARVLASIPQQADQIEQLYNDNYDAIWHTPGVDPQDVLTAMVDAAGNPVAAQVFALTNQIMGLARPSALKSVPPQYTYAVNADGSITLTPVPLPPAPAMTPDGPVEEGAV